jgi:hypothetical protein
MEPQVPHTLQGLKVGLAEAEAVLQALKQQQADLHKEKAAAIADSDKQLQQLRVQLQAAREQLNARDEAMLNMQKSIRKGKAAAGGGKGKSSGRGTSHDGCSPHVQLAQFVRSQKGNKMHQQQGQQQLASENSLSVSSAAVKKRKQALSLGSGAEKRTPVPRKSFKGGPSQQEQEQQKAADGKRRLSSADFNEGLAGKWLQLYWPDDGTWWQGYCASVDMAQKKALVIYETSMCVWSFQSCRLCAAAPEMSCLFLCLCPPGAIAGFW